MNNKIPPMYPALSESAGNVESKSEQQDPSIESQHRLVASEEYFTPEQYGFMARAMALAAVAEQQGEVPVGAVVVYQGKIIGEGWNQTISTHDATAHAEIQALREAGKVLSNYRLLDTTLYVTLEPCPMCAGAMVHSRVGEVIYATDDLKTGAAGSVMNLLSYDGVNHHVKIQSGLLRVECKEQLQAFFRRRRKEKKAAKKALNKM